MENLLKEIKDFFPDFIISISDLKSPSNKFVREFYLRILLELGVDVDNIQKVQMSQIDAIEIDIIPQLNLMTAIRTALPFIKFNLNDLLSPDVKRNAAQISQVMNFLMFCDTRCAANNKKIEEFQAAKQNERELADEKDEITNALNKLAIELDSNQQTKSEMEGSIAKLQNDIERYSEGIEELKQRCNAAQEMLSAREAELENLSQEIRMLDSECEEVKDFETKRSERDRVRERKEEYQEKLRVLASDIEGLKRLTEILNKRIVPILNELHVIRECSELKSSVMKAQEGLELMKHKKEEVLNDLNALDKKISSDEETFLEKLASLEKQESSFKEALEVKENEYKMKMKEIRQSEKKSSQEMENANNLIAAIESDYQALVAKFNAVMEKLYLQRKELLQ